MVQDTHRVQVGGLPIALDLDLVTAHLGGFDMEGLPEVTDELHMRLSMTSTGSVTPMRT